MVIVTPVLCLWGLSALIIKELTLPPTCAILPYALLQVPLVLYLGGTRGGDTGDAGDCVAAVAPRIFAIQGHEQSLFFFIIFLKLLLFLNFFLLPFFLGFVLGFWVVPFYGAGSRHALSCKVGGCPLLVFGCLLVNSRLVHLAK